MRERKRMERRGRSASKAFSGMAALLTMLGSAVLQTRSICSFESFLFSVTKQQIQNPSKKSTPLTNFWEMGEIQVAQVLLTLPYSFSQLGMLSGIIFQIFYGILGSWTAYLISVLYVEYRSRKEKENVSFKNHVIQVFFFFQIFNIPTLPISKFKHLSIITSS